MKRVISVLAMVAVMQFGAVAQNAQWIVEPIYEQIGEHTDAVTAVKRDGKWGYLDAQGKEFVKCEFDKIYPFADGVSIATTKDGKLQAIIHEDGYVVNKFKNNNGGIVELKINPIYPYFNNDMILVTDGSEGTVQGALTYPKWGYLNKNGIVSIPVKHFLALPFSDGKAKVTNDEMKNFYINNDGSVAIAENASGVKSAINAFSFYNGAALVCDKSKLYYIDETGHKVENSADFTLKNIASSKIFYDEAKNSLISDQNRIEIDEYGRARKVVQSDNSEYNLIEVQPKVVETFTGASSFIFNDKKTKDELRWLSSENAVLEYNGKCGIVKVKKEPVLSAKLTKESVSSIFGNVEPTALTITNNINQTLNGVKVEVNGVESELKSIPATSVDVAINVDKPTDAERDVVKQSVKATQYGVLLLDESVDVAVVDQPALVIKGSSDYFHNKANNTFSMSVIIENTSDYNLDGATLMINSSQQTISLAPQSSQNYFAIFDLETDASTIDVVISIKHPKSPIITRKGTLVLDNINK